MSASAAGAKRQFSGKPTRRRPSSKVLSCSAQNCGALSLLVQGRNAYHCASELISGRIKLEQINDGFAALKSGAPVRQLIDFAA